MFFSVLLLILIQFSFIQTYTFDSSIDNLLYVTNTSTLYAISSSYLHQLHWSTTNQTLLLLHRRVQLHSSLDNTENGVSVFLYEQTRNLLIICSRSSIGRCILYDANDISRIYILDSTIETNYLGCLSGCYTFLSSTIIRSALNGNRREKNGNIINSIIDFKKDLFHFNIKYQFQSSDHRLITSLTFLSENFLNISYIYGFDYQQYTYYLLKSSKLARLCQASIAMQMTYEEIPLISCEKNLTNITGAFHSFGKSNDLYIIYDNILCIYTMNDIIQAFKQSKNQCQQGIGYRLGFIIDSEEIAPKCEKVDEESLSKVNECTWKPYRMNTYMDGTVGAIGSKLYQSNEKIIFVFAHDNIVIIGTNQQHVMKFIRSNQTILYLIHKTIYQNKPFNTQYVIDHEYQSLIFAIGTELHRYAYNSCSLYDSCQSCIGSRRYDNRPCIWFNGKCSLSSNSLINDRSCPPIINQIQPMNISVNTEHILLTIRGSFEEIQKDFIKILVKFPLLNQREDFCTIETIQNDSLTCNLILPKQATDGSISINIQPRKRLFPGDTDISGSIEYPDKFKIYIPKAILVPNYGPAVGGTKIRIQNLDFNFYSTIKIFLGKNECEISKYDYSTDEIECINQACINDREQLELNIQVNNYSWQIEKTFFQCRANPIVLDWFPKKAIISGGMKLFVSGQNLDVVQKPMMKSIYNSSIFEFISSCESISTSQMICLSPIIDKNLELIPSFDLEVSFIMDNMNIIPDKNILTIIHDPIYYPFADSIQLINSTNIVQFEGLNLMTNDQINIRIDNINNACIPFNYTDTYLSCLIFKSVIKNFTNFEPSVEVVIGTNLTFSIGKLQFQKSSSLLVPYSSHQFSPWTIISLIILSSITILTVLFSLVIFTRRRYYHASQQFRKETKPPQYYQRIWSELGKTRQINRKKIILHEKVGQGCFGDVYRGELKENNSKSIEVAIKVLRDQTVSSMNEFLYEANRMKDFSHMNILSLIGVSWDPSRKAMVLLPYMKNGDLRSYISNEKNRPTVRQLILWGIQVADGMEYLSSLKFIHRDLATRNCMLDEQLICRISDFGLSRDIIDRDYYVVPTTTTTTTTTKENDGNTIQMTPRRLPIRWLSPESIESSKYTIQSDVWSFGILLWELMSRGKTPYPGIDNADIYTYIKHGYRLQQPTYCPPLLYKSAMILCWNVDPSQRPTFTQLAHDIRHILHQLELEQKRKQSSSADDDDTTIIQRYPMDRKIKRLSTTSLSSTTSSIGEQYITTPHRQSENEQLLFDRKDDDDDAYAIAINASAEMFSTTRLLPEYTETSITEEI